MEAKLSLENANFSYGKKEVFHDLNLNLYPGEVYCVLGSNGCGKTTLLRCLNGGLKLEKGRVLLKNRNIISFGINQLAQEIGIVFQEHSISFPYSVLEVVTMGRAPYLGFFDRPSKKDSEIAMEKLEIVGISHLRNKSYTQISGGERQLVLIARTLTQEPDIILLDEPTSHLDFKNQILILRIINKLVKQGLTVIMSSHFPNHALLFSSRVSLMAQGKFIATGRPMEVINEENLEMTYGIKVKILSSNNGSKEGKIKFCIPAEEVI
ncbi:MAG: ABC transporter ATP-binding protein [Atribacterota bacterium]|nr:ABC transporter ATP-binding protein [Atribacterota bacterium]